MNYGAGKKGIADWIHVNSVDYNPEFDQIILGVDGFIEIWVIEHQTTTEEAAGPRKSCYIIDGREHLHRRRIALRWALGGLSHEDSEGSGARTSR